MKILLIIGLYFFTYMHVFAGIASELSIEKNTFRIDESIIIELLIEGENMRGGIDNYSIEGMHNFNIFSQSQNFQRREINGEVHGRFILQFHARARESGQFTIGPTVFEFGGQSYSNDTVYTLEIVSNTPQNILQNGQQDNISTPELYGFIEYDAKRSFFPFKYIVYIIIIVILSSILGYALQQFLYKKQKKSISYINDIHQETKSMYDIYFSDLTQDQNSNIFIKKYLIGVESFLTQKDIHDINYHPLTLSELQTYQNFQNYGLKNDFQILYENYYQQKELTNEEKQQYIENLKTYFI